MTRRHWGQFICLAKRMTKLRAVIYAPIFGASHGQWAHWYCAFQPHAMRALHAAALAQTSLNLFKAVFNEKIYVYLSLKLAPIRLRISD